MGNNTLLNFLGRIGLNADTQLSLIGLLSGLIAYQGSGGDGGLPYRRLEDSFQNCSQAYPEIKGILNNHVWDCDFTAEKGKKTYCYTVKPFMNELLVKSNYIELFKDMKRDAKKVGNQKNRILKKINGKEGAGTLSYHVVTVGGEDSFISHNIESFSKVEKTEETKALLGQQIERMEKETIPDIKDTQARSLICTLANLKKLYSLSIDVEMTSPDGRWHNPWTSLPAEVRKTITINGKKSLGVIDLRSCHPSFFAEYIVSLISNPSAELLKEKEKWNDYFFASASHPLKTLANTLCLDYDDTENELGEITRLGLKKGFNSHLNSMGFNGSRFNPDHKNGYILNPLNRWIRTNFPLLYGIWMQTDLKTTGNQIALKYESRIMQSPLLFQKANELGIYLCSEHDGLGIFGDNPADVDTILDVMRGISLEEFGINIAVTKK